MPLTKKEILAFIAGVFEGEGSISISSLGGKSWNKRTDYSLKVRISNTDRNLLDWIVDNYGGKIYKSTTVNNKIVWAWSVHTQKAENFLNTMMPYLICKKERAKIALEFRRTKDNGHRNWYRIPEAISKLREEIYLRLKQLNAKGGINVSTN